LCCTPVFASGDRLIGDAFQTFRNVNAVACGWRGAVDESRKLSECFALCCRYVHNKVSGQIIPLKEKEVNVLAKVGGGTEKGDWTLGRMLTCREDERLDEYYSMKGVDDLKRMPIFFAVIISSSPFSDEHCVVIYLQDG
jgi:hypothetical protein